MKTQGKFIDAIKKRRMTATKALVVRLREIDHDATLRSEDIDLRMSPGFASLFLADCLKSGSDLRQYGPHHFAVHDEDGDKDFDFKVDHQLNAFSFLIRVRGK